MPAKGRGRICVHDLMLIALSAGACALDGCAAQKEACYASGFCGKPGASLHQAALALQKDGDSLFVALATPGACSATANQAGIGQFDQDVAAVQKNLNANDAAEQAQVSRTQAGVHAFLASIPSGGCADPGVAQAQKASFDANVATLVSNTQ